MRHAERSLRVVSGLHGEALEFLSSPRFARGPGRDCYDFVKHFDKQSEVAVIRAGSRRTVIFLSVHWAPIKLPSSFKGKTIPKSRCVRPFPSRKG